MNEKTELLKHIYEDSEMASYTIEELLQDLEKKDNKIKKLTQELLNEYQDFLYKSKDIFNSKNKKLPQNSMIGKLSAKMGIDKNVKDDNSDSSIATMLIKGISTGIINTEKKINDYKDIVDNETLDLAKKFLYFQQQSIEKLKIYL
ncbi:MAG: hypothetical protein PHR25_02745 [Clostridia bacterium]|nr:hypothetical protein [Clostridia bacterium]MDD4375678.1 hypothetical protein [Clostridia bacterium]